MTDYCAFIASDEPRVLPDRHLPDCDTADCAGCEPCPERHCCICNRSHVTHAHPLTCPGCVGDLRNTLYAIQTLWGELLATAMLGSGGTGLWARPLAAAAIPGGDALVMLSPYGDGSADVLLRWSRSCQEHPAGCPVEAHEPVDYTAQTHMQSLELPSDPEAVLLNLARWEDIWRDWLDHPAGSTASVPSAVVYLAEHLPRMAQTLDRFGPQGWEFAPDFGEFASDVRRMHSRLENVNHEGTRDDKAAAPCFDCGGTLVRRYTDHGRVDDYTCQRCRKVYPGAHYWLAVRAHVEEANQAC